MANTTDGVAPVALPGVSLKTPSASVSHSYVSPCAELLSVELEPFSEMVRPAADVALTARSGGFASVGVLTDASAYRCDVWPDGKLPARVTFSTASVMDEPALNCSTLSTVLVLDADCVPFAPS